MIEEVTKHEALLPLENVTSLMEWRYGGETVQGFVNFPERRTVEQNGKRTVIHVLALTVRNNPCGEGK